LDVNGNGPPVPGAPADKQVEDDGDLASENAEISKRSRKEPENKSDRGKDKIEQSEKQVIKVEGNVDEGCIVVEPRFEESEGTITGTQSEKPKSRKPLPALLKIGEPPAPTPQVPSTLQVLIT
jgi:hypothetical protein